MKNNGYYISLTPDIVYKPKIQALATDYPLDYLMVETDGPWPFEGPFQNQTTVPSMMHQSVQEIARLKRVSVTETYDFYIEIQLIFIISPHKKPFPKERLFISKFVSQVLRSAQSLQ